MLFVVNFKVLIYKSDQSSPLGNIKRGSDAAMGDQASHSI
jgi:hypothetical protein